MMRWQLTWRIVCHTSVALACSTFALVACKGDDNSETVDSGVETSAINGDAPTWYQDIAPIVTPKCSGCHQDGGIAPFSMETYESAKIFAAQMADAVEAGRMPPFLAQDTDECTPRLPWKNDLRLSDDEKAAIRAWADAKAPKGDAKKAAKTATPQAAKLEREDVIMKVPEEFVIDGVEDLHRCVIVDPKLDHDAVMIGSLITSGNPAVLHHVVSYLVQPGINDDGTDRTKAQLEAAIKADKDVGIGEYYDCFGGPGLQNASFQVLNAWAPGGVPSMAPENAGMPIDKDALVILDMHYHPTGAGVEKDSKTKLSLMTTDVEPKWISRTILLGNFEEPRETPAGTGKLLKKKGETKAEFLIPAGEKHHVEEMTWTWDFSSSSFGAVDFRVVGVGTHMHYVGRDMLVTLEHGDESENPGDKECLIQTPSWDFNWQRGYTYDAPREDLPIMGQGDVLRLRCTYDNSLDNRFVVEALDDQGLTKPVDVPLGENTLDEMCLIGIGIMYPNVNAGKTIGNEKADAGISDADAGQ